MRDSSVAELLREQGDTSWIEQGLCRNSTEKEKWFPGRGESSQPAKAICARCPVVAECLDYALRHRVAFGIWGCTSERERRTLRKEKAGRYAVCPVCTRVFVEVRCDQRFCSPRCQRVERNRRAAQRRAHV